MQRERRGEQSWMYEEGEVLSMPYCRRHAPPPSPYPPAWITGQTNIRKDLQVLTRCFSGKLAPMISQTLGKMRRRRSVRDPSP